MSWLFSFNGRIPRLSYFGGIILLTVVTLVIYAALALLVGMPQIPTATPSGAPPVPPPSGAGGTAAQVSMMPLLVMLPIWILSTWAGFALAAKRFHDMGSSGWLSLLLLVPLVGFIVVLVLLFKGGEAGQNQYGPAPA
jgi:uncharacterized membrane protein YhaH (DUF805 family)